MQEEDRTFFDRHFDEIVAQMPPQVHRLLEDVTMYVEDYPSIQVMRRMNVQDRSHLCGLYTGIPLTDRRVEQAGVLSDAVYIYREGIFRMAGRWGNHRDDKRFVHELRRQIGITVLHELGHHHGLTEEDLEEMGYA